MKNLIIASLGLLCLTEISSAQRFNYQVELSFPDALARAVPWEENGFHHIDLHWRYRMAAGKVVERTERLPASFKVNYVADAGSGRLFLSGKSAETGNTVIQLWQVQRPDLLLTFPSGEPVLSLNGVSRIATLQDSDDPERRSVRWAARFLHSDKLLVTYSTGHCWEYGLTGGPRRLVLSPNGEAGTNDLPSDFFHVPMYSRDHETLGRFIIVVSRRSSVPSLLLIDSDRDGLLDQSQTLTPAQRESLGLDDPDQILEGLRIPPGGQ